MLVFAFLLFVAAANKVEATEISCEEISSCSDLMSECCLFNKTTVIDTVNVTIEGVEMGDINEISFDNNKQIEFLPVDVYKKFPNLRLYYAQNASVKAISALNFERMMNLKVLFLEGNQIESIPNFCFEGLIKLTSVILSK